VEEVVKGLDVRVEVLAEALDRALEDKVQRGVVAGRAKGAVAAVLVGDVVQVPEDTLQTVLRQ
jgi:hypothetical protein